MDPNFELEEVWCSAATFALDQGDLEAVENYCRKLIEQAKLSIKASPTNSNYWATAFMGCNRLADCGRYDQAMALFDDLISSSPDHSSDYAKTAVPRFKELLRQYCGMRNRYMQGPKSH
jgi:tetratricopeptide (TPR) repeat protein